MLIKTIQEGLLADDFWVSRPCEVLKVIFATAIFTVNFRLWKHSQGSKESAMNVIYAESRLSEAEI